MKRYVEYKDSGFKPIDKIPAHWKLLRLKYTSNIQNSNVDKKAYKDEISVRLCNYVDVYKNLFITPDLELMNATATKRVTIH